MRCSITNPDAYIEANLIGFYNILEACWHSYDNSATEVEHLIYASSSSVYGSNTKIPYSTEDKVDNPVSLYAATKKSNELLAYAYSKHRIIFYKESLPKSQERILGAQLFSLYRRKKIGESLKRWTRLLCGCAGQFCSMDE